MLEQEPHNAGAMLARAEFALASEDPELALDLALKAKVADPNVLGTYLVGARAAAALFDWDQAKRLLGEGADVLGPRPELTATRIHILRQTRDHAAVAALVAESRAAGQANFGLWNECADFEIALGRFAEAAAALESAPANTPRERAQVFLLSAKAAEGRRDYAAAVACYREALASGPAPGGWHSELARCLLLLADTDAAREELVASFRLDRSALQVMGRVSNISQHHVGHLLDEFVLDQATLVRLREAASLSPQMQLPSLRSLVAEAPDETAPAILFLLAARRAGRLAAQRPAQAPLPAGSRVPRRIAQFWDDAPPDDIAALTDTWRTRNPGHAYECFDDETAADFIAARHAAAVAEAFERSEHPAQRADLFRLAWLAAEGGVYADADDRCDAPLDDIVPAWATFAGYQENYGTLANNFLCATPSHPIIVRALELATTAINRGDRDVIWLKTGPGLVTRAMAQVACQDEGLVELSSCSIMELWEAQRVIGLHCPARYKRTDQHWSRSQGQSRTAMSLKG